MPHPPSTILHLHMPLSILLTWPFLWFVDWEPLIAAISPYEVANGVGFFCSGVRSVWFSLKMLLFLFYKIRTLGVCVCAYVCNGYRCSMQTNASKIFKKFVGSSFSQFRFTHRTFHRKKSISSILLQNIIRVLCFLFLLLSVTSF